MDSVLVLILIMYGILAHTPRLDQGHEISKRQLTLSTCPLAYINSLPASNGKVSSCPMSLRVGVSNSQRPLYRPKYSSRALLIRAPHQKEPKIHKNCHLSSLKGAFKGSPGTLPGPAERRNRNSQESKSSGLHPRGCTSGCGVFRGSLQRGLLGDMGPCRRAISQRVQLPQYSGIRA